MGRKEGERGTWYARVRVQALGQVHVVDFGHTEWCSYDEAKARDHKAVGKAVEEKRRVNGHCW